jgi:uncharacterized protein
MNKFGKFLAFMALLTVFILGVAYIPIGSTKNLAEGWDGDTSASCLVDDADLFGKKDEKQLNSVIRETADELELNILIYVAGSDDAHLSDEATEAKAHNMYDETYGEYTDGVLYYMDMSGGYSAYDFISTSGKATVMYQKDIENIFTYLDGYLPASGEQIVPEEIYSAIEAFCRQLETKKSRNQLYFHDTYHGLYNYFERGEFRVTRSKPFPLRALIMLVCTAIGALIALIVHACIKRHYKFKTAANPSVYVAREKTAFTERSDVQTRTHVSKVRIESSSGGGGSRGGGGHSFGGSHGGGGHHR